MPIDMVAFWDRVFASDIRRRAEKVHTEGHFERWCKESRGWMTHLIEIEAKRENLTDFERKRLADVCIAHFNDAYLQLCIRVYGGDSIEAIACG